MTSCTGSARRILGDFEKVSELRWELPRRKTVGFCLLAETFVAGATCVGGADEKARIERMRISLPYVEAFNSKVIKGFVPKLRSRYMFFEFRDSYVLCIYVMNVPCTFRIFMYTAMVQFLQLLTMHF